MGSSHPISVEDVKRFYVILGCIGGVTVFGMICFCILSFFLICKAHPEEDDYVSEKERKSLKARSKADNNLKVLTNADGSTYLTTETKKLSWELREAEYAAATEERTETGKRSQTINSNDTLSRIVIPAEVDRKKTETDVEMEVEAPTETAKKSAEPQPQPKSLQSDPIVPKPKSGETEDINQIAIPAAAAFKQKSVENTSNNTENVIPVEAAELPELKRKSEANEEVEAPRDEKKPEPVIKLLQLEAPQKWKNTKKVVAPEKSEAVRAPKKHREEKIEPKVEELLPQMELQVPALAEVKREKNSPPKEPAENMLIHAASTTQKRQRTRLQSVSFDTPETAPVRSPRDKEMKQLKQQSSSETPQKRNVDLQSNDLVLPVPETATRRQKTKLESVDSADAGNANKKQASSADAAGSEPEEIAIKPRKTSQDADASQHSAEVTALTTKTETSVDQNQVEEDTDYEKVDEAQTKVDPNYIQSGYRAKGKLAPYHMSASQFTHKGPLVIRKEKFDPKMLKQEVDEESDAEPKSDQRLSFRSELNEVYDIGEDVEIVIDETQRNKKSKKHTAARSKPRTPSKKR